jgi:hypothetical protein
VRFVRPAILAAVVSGIVLALIEGLSYASQPTAQISGYGAPQVVPDQVINGHNASSSHIGLWIGILIALLVLAMTAFFGWKKTHSSEYV